MNISDSQVKRAAALIDESGAAELLDHAMRTSRRGRKPRLSMRNLLVGWYLATEQAGFSDFKATADALASLSDGARKALDLPYASNEHKALYDAVLRITARLHKFCVTREFANMLLEQDLIAAELPIPVDNETGTPDFDRCEVEYPELWISDDELADRHSVLEQVSNSILDVTLNIAPRPDGAALAIDETGIQAWMKPKRDGKTGDRDPDAMFGTKTKKSGGTETYFGYSAHALVRAASLDPKDPDVVPLIERLAVTPAKSDVPAVSLALIDSAIEAHGTIGEILGDRLYSYSRTEKWAYPLLDRGIKQVLDLRIDEQKFRPIKDGMKVNAGAVYCQGAPARLENIPKPEILQEIIHGDEDDPDSGYSLERRTDDEYAKEVSAFEDLIHEREQFAMFVKQPPRKGTNMRVSCPAQRDKVGCPLYDELHGEKSVEVGRINGLPIVLDHPEVEHAPRCCTQESVTVSDDWAIKHYQEHTWGSPEWKESIVRRNRVEGAYGNIKNEKRECVKRGFVKTNGLHIFTIAMTLAGSSQNVRMLRAWAEDEDKTVDVDRDHELLKPDIAPIGLVYEYDEGVEAPFAA